LLGLVGCFVLGNVGKVVAKDFTNALAA